MKQTSALFLLTSVFLCAVSGHAQCSGQYYFQKGKIVKMDVYGKTGKNDGQISFTVQDVQTAGGQTTATVLSEYFSAKGKKLSESTANYTCAGDSVVADMTSYIPAASLQAFKNGKATFSGTNLSYPYHLNTGQYLPDGSFTATADLGVMKQTLTVSITNRQVTGRETITVAGKNWDAFKIAYTTTIAMKAVIGNKSTIAVTEWYSPDFGVLKTESESGKTALSSIN